MANVKISELPEVVSLNSTDIIPVVQSGITKRSTSGAVIATMPGFTQSGSGVVATTAQNELRSWVRPEQFGAVGDGATNDYAALQAALNTNRPIKLQAGKNYLTNTALDCTNRASGGVFFMGDSEGEGSSNATVTLNTGGVGIDCTGSQYVGFQNVALVSGTSTPSTLGVLLARSTTSQFAQFASFKNVRVNIATDITKFGGRGTVGIYNNAAELCDFENVYLRSDNPLVCVGLNDFSVASVYRTIDGSITSASRIKMHGGNNTLSSLNASAFGLYLANFLDFDGDFYSLGSGGAHICAYIVGCTKVKLRGHFESYARAVKFGNGNNNMDIFVDMAVGASSPFLFDTSLFVGMNFSTLACYNFAGTGTAPYVVEGLATHQLRWSKVSAFNWTPATSYTNILNLNGNWVFLNGVEAASISGVVNVASDTATPANGSSSAKLLLGTTAGFGIYYGSGAPTVSAGKGSLYLRSDGTTTNDRAYINTNAGTTWTALTTAA